MVANAEGAFEQCEVCAIDLAPMIDRQHLSGIAVAALKHQLDRANAGQGKLGDLLQGVRRRIVIGGLQILRLAISLQIDNLDRNLVAREPGARRRGKMVGELLVEFVIDVAMHRLCDAERHTTVHLAMYHVQDGDKLDTGFD